MIDWAIQTFGGFVITCFLILIFCDTFGVPIHINLTP